MKAGCQIVAVGSEVGLLVGASDGLVKRLNAMPPLTWTATMDRGVIRRGDAIEWDCAQALTRFFNYFDQWRYEDMAGLFAPNGVWHRQGKALQGKDAIVAVLNTRSRTQTVRHVVTNVQIEVTDAMTAEFLLYVTAYIHDSGTKLRKAADHSDAVAAAGGAGATFVKRGARSGRSPAWR